MRRGFDLRPAMAASALLHAGVLAAGLVAWRAHEDEPEKLLTSVPVTLVSAADAPVAPAAAEGPGPPEATPLPLETAAAEPPAPPVAQRPAPSPPQPASPQPAPAPARTGPGPQKPAAPPAKPQPQKPAPARPTEPSLDLEELSARIAKTAPRRQPRPAPAAAEGAPDPRASLGGPSAGHQDALAALAAKLQDLWNPNCQAEGGDTINVRVRFQLAPDGRLVGQPQVVGGGGSSPLARAAEDRAVRAVFRGAPYEELPADLRGQAVTVRFDAARACAG